MLADGMLPSSFWCIHEIKTKQQKHIMFLKCVQFLFSISVCVYIFATSTLTHTLHIAHMNNTSSICIVECIIIV